MKQKTPLTELKERIIAYKREHFKNNRNDQTKNVVDAILAVILSDCNELLQKEKEVIIESLKFYMNTDGIGNADGLAEVHFNETFTQK